MRDALPENAPRPFVLLDAVAGAGPEGLTAWRRFDAAPVWQGLEAAAQAAALHQRFLSGFSRHAFLLSVDDCRFPGAILDGRFELRAVLLGQSLRAATYRVDLFPCGGAGVPRQGSAENAAMGAGGRPEAMGGGTRRDNAETEADGPCSRLHSPGAKGDGPAAFPAPARLLVRADGDACPAAWTVFLGVGLASYDETFKRDALESRYRRLFQWLTRNDPSATVSRAG